MTALIVYPYKRIPNGIRESVPKGYAMDKSDNGWMTRDVLYDFVKNTFYPENAISNISKSKKEKKESCRIMSVFRLCSVLR